MLYGIFNALTQCKNNNIIITHNHYYIHAGRKPFHGVNKNIPTYLYRQWTGSMESLGALIFVAM